MLLEDSPSTYSPPPPHKFSFDSCMRSNLFHLVYWQMSISDNFLDGFRTCCLFHMVGIVAKKDAISDKSASNANLKLASSFKVYSGCYLLVGYF